MAPRNVLVVGATGKQGRSLIQALLSPRAATDIPTDLQYHVLALTRNAASGPARALLEAEHEHAHSITLVEGNLDDIESIRRIFEDARDTGKIWGVFTVLAYPGLGASADNEEQQGRVSTHSIPACSVTTHETRTSRVCRGWQRSLWSSMLRHTFTRRPSRLDWVKTDRLIFLTKPNIGWSSTAGS